MADPIGSTESHLARRLLEGVRALQEGRPADAIAPLLEVAHDAELAAAEELADVRARACSLLAGAQLQVGNLDEAAWAAGQALALLRAVDDTTGHQRVQGVWTAIVEARQLRKSDALNAASAAKLREWSLDDLEDHFGAQPLRLADALIKKANAEAEGGVRDLAVVAAERALVIALDTAAVREEVLARLSLARAAPERAAVQFEAAWRRAERANEFNLVGAVARAAAAAGVELAVQLGPDMTRKQREG